MGPVLVVAPPEPADAPAYRALRIEGLQPTLVRLPEDPLAYGRLLTDQWAAGAGFVLVEADTVPWPGAIAALWECSEPWCGYDYPLAPGHLDGGLGCVRFSTGLLRAAPGLSALWHNVKWNALDLAVREAITGSHRTSYHRHLPPVAHARQRTD